MALTLIAAYTYEDVAFFSFAILFVFVLLMATFLFGWWVSKRQVTLSPYSKRPLRKGSDLPYYGIESVLRYLYRLHEYDNRMFHLNRAAYCRETGRIFPNALTWYNTLNVDWNFLQRSYPGNWVSWGSLSDKQQEFVLKSHHQLEGYQMERSSRQPQPRLVEPEYAFSKPGPLYVDLDTSILLGWKCIPNTDYEVLIVTKPRGKFETPKTL